MEGEGTEIKSLAESRFESIIFLFRLAGIPFHMKKISPIYAIYMTTVIFCTTTTYLGMLVDVNVNRNDLGHALTTIGVVIPITNVMWL
jgi:hypothetical protein